MFVVQLASNAWLHPTLGVTTSMAHAHAHASLTAAEQAARSFLSDRAPVLAASCLTPRQRAFYSKTHLSVVPLAELQARMATVNGRHEPGEPKAATPVAEKPARNSGSGVTRQIYQWTLDHPSATKADAIAAFPSANPSTVGVQFGAARRSVQQ